MIKKKKKNNNNNNNNNNNERNNNCNKNLKKYENDNKYNIYFYIQGHLGLFQKKIKLSKF